MTTIKEDLDDFMMIAATLCNCEIGFITFIDEEYKLLKPSYGLQNRINPFDASAYNQFFKKISSLTIIENFGEYIRSSKNTSSLRASPYNFYAGCPLITQNGDCIGILSVWDTEINKLSTNQKKSFQNICNQVVKLLDSESKLKINYSDLKNENTAEFYKKIVDDYNIGTWELDIQTSNVKVDNTSASLLGYKITDLQQLNLKSCVNIFHPDDFLSYWKILKDVYNKKINKYDYKFRIKHKNEQWVWTLVRGQVVKSDSNGNPLLLSGTLFDVNEQKIKELQLNAILDNVNCVAFRHILYPDGIQKTVNISKGAMKLWGLTDEEVFSDHNNIWNLVHLDDVTYLSNTVQQSASTLQEWKAEWRINHPDGSLRWHRGQGIPIKNKDGSVSWDSAVIDITADKKTEEQLKDLNKKLNQAQDIANLGYWQKDLKTLEAYWSDKVYEIFDLEKNDSKPKFALIENFISPQEREIINTEREIAIKLNQEFRTENKITLKNGTIKWVRQIGHYSKNKKGKPISYEGTIQDITKSKLVSLELEESIERYNYVTKATSDAIWDLDFIKGKLYWGDNYKKLFGHPSLDDAAADIAYWESKIHPEDRERVVFSFNSCIEDGKTNWQEEYRFINKNNEYSNVIDKAFVVRNENGAAIRMVGAIQDITDKLKAFEEIKISNERFEKVADATHDAIWDWDLVNDILYQGPGYFKLFGHESSKNKGKLSSWKKNVHPEDLPMVIANSERIQESASEDYFSIEYRYLKSDGNYAFVIDRGRVIRNLEGKVIRMVGAMQDITESKIYEESLRELNYDLEKQAHELSQYNEELEQFAYVVSHDLQEPLRMISSFLILLEKKYNTVLDEEGKKYIHFAVDGAKRMRQIILDLLDFSRVGRTDEELETINLNSLISEIKLVFGQEIEDKKAQIKSHILPQIKSYKILLEQLFQNLIGNALKYQKEGETPIINIIYEDIGTHHKFLVSDNGIGIDKEYFDKIFVIFQRLHGRNQYHGTGIGLALAKKIVDNLQGKIWVESEVGVGSKFVFTIKKNSNL